MIGPRTSFGGFPSGVQPFAAIASAPNGTLG